MDNTRTLDAPVIQRLTHGRRRTPRWSAELLDASRARLRRLGVEGATAGLAYAALLSLAPLAFGALAVASFVPALRIPLEGTLTHDWLERARPSGPMLAALCGGAFLALSAPLFGLARSALEDVFETWSEREPSLLESIGRRSIALIAWAGFVSAVGLTLGASTAAGGAAFALLVLSSAVAYRVLAPVRLGVGDLLEAALVLSVGMECVLLAVRAIATSVALGDFFDAAGVVIAVMGLPFAAARAFLFGAALAAELSRRRAEAYREQAALEELSAP